MKKTVFSLLALLILSSGAMAKNAKILGKWLLTKAKTGDKTEEVYQVVTFKKDGYAEMQGRVIGTWKKSKKTITIESEMIKEFAGKWKIAKHTKTKLVLKKGESALYLSVYKLKKIKAANKKSGFAGVWKLQQKNKEGADVYLKFELPNILRLHSLAPGHSGKNSGLWIFKKKSNTLILMIREPMLRGIGKVKKISKGKFTLEKDGKKIKAKRIKQEAAGREELNFATEDDSAENTELKQLNPEEFPWFNTETKIAYLKTVAQITYKKSTLLEDLDIFISEEITAKVSLDEDMYQAAIDNIFGNLSARTNDSENVFYPLQEPDEYRVAADKEITVPAGTFKCKVIEINDDFENRKLRCYMIKDRPGIYAKIILVEDEVGHEKYSMYELTDIKEK